MRKGRDAKRAAPLPYACRSGRRVRPVRVPERAPHADGTHNREARAVEDIHEVYDLVRPRPIEPAGVTRLLPQVPQVLVRAQHGTVGDLERGVAGPVQNERRAYEALETHPRVLC